ncbi:hypothetical protein [Actomonas aquatica]|uniref:Uncharacterized protein n=1 Tax=Actomonas aquatica TaxID=2866162 RepID=A0ABZ1CFH9_9BACT|nr:hypothetical protein [Opitutus sp. WL0086]WRQ89040.1 hypothetical protein K1X11_006445 [Opitutus sp. WL0086]
MSLHSMGLELVETVIYLTNTLICVILAVLVTDAWFRGDHKGSLLYWMIAAWVMFAADVLFASRPLLSPVVARILPTLLVTVGQAILLIGARVNSGQTKVTLVEPIGAVVLHAVLLTVFHFLAPESPLRRVSNGLIWATLAYLSYRGLRQSPPVFWRSYTAPAKAFMAHAIFHLVRTVLVLLPLSSTSEALNTFVAILGDLEVSFFMVALFVGLLLAHLKQRNEQLSSALAEVKTLSGLLPICAWCKKVRDDDGYWQQVDHYFRNHSKIRFSHGMCTDCADDFRKEAEKLQPSDL